MAVQNKQTLDIAAQGLQLLDFDADTTTPNTPLTKINQATISPETLQIYTQNLVAHTAHTVTVGQPAVAITATNTQTQAETTAKLSVTPAETQLDLSSTDEQFSIKVQQGDAQVTMTDKVLAAFKNTLGVPQQVQVPISYPQAIGNVTLPAANLSSYVPLYYSTGYDISALVLNFDNITGTGFFYLQVKVGNLPPNSQGYPTITFPGGSATQYVTGTHTFLIDNLIAATTWTVTEITKDNLTLPDFSTFATKFTQEVEKQDIPVYNQSVPVQWTPKTIRFQNFTSSSSIYTSGDLLTFANGQVIGYNFSSSSLVYGFKNTSGPPGFQSGYITLAGVTPGQLSVNWSVSSLDISAAGACTAIASSAIADLYTQNMFVSGMIPQTFNLIDVYNSIPKTSYNSILYTVNVGQGSWLKVAQLTSTNFAGNNPYWSFKLAFVPDTPQKDNIVNPDLYSSNEQLAIIQGDTVFITYNKSAPGNMQILASINSELQNSDNVLSKTHFYYGEYTDSSGTDYPSYWTQFDVPGKVYFMLTSLSDNIKEIFQLSLEVERNEPTWTNGCVPAEYVYNDFNESKAYWFELPAVQIGLNVYAIHLTLLEPDTESYSDSAQIYMENPDGSIQGIVTLVGLGQTHTGVNGTTYNEQSIIYDYSDTNTGFTATYELWVSGVRGKDAGIQTTGLDLHLTRDVTIVQLVNPAKLVTQNAFRFTKKFTTKSLQQDIGLLSDLSTQEKNNIVAAINETYEEATDFIVDDSNVSAYPLGTKVFPYECTITLSPGDGSQYTFNSLASHYTEQWSELNEATGILTLWGGYSIDFALGNMTVTEAGQTKYIIKNGYPVVPSPYTIQNDKVLYVSQITGNWALGVQSEPRVSMQLKRNITTAYLDLGPIEKYDSSGLNTYIDFVAQAAFDAKSVVDYQYVDATYNLGWEGLYNYIAIKDDTQYSDLVPLNLSGFMITYTDNWAWGLEVGTGFIGIFIRPGRVDFEYPDGTKTADISDRKYIWSVGNNPAATAATGSFDGLNPDFYYLFDNYPYKWHKEILDGKYQEYTLFPMFWLLLNRDLGFLTFQDNIVGVCDLLNVPQIKYLITYNEETNTIMHGDHAALQTPSATSTKSIHGKMIDLVGVTNTLYDMAGIAICVPLLVWTSVPGSPTGVPIVKPPDTVIPDQTLLRLDFSATVQYNRTIVYRWNMTDSLGDTWALECQLTWSSSSYLNSYFRLIKTTGDGVGQYPDLLYDGGESVAWIHIPGSTVIYYPLPKVLWGGTIEAMDVNSISSLYLPTGPVPGALEDQGPGVHDQIFSLCAIKGARFLYQIIKESGIKHRYVQSNAERVRLNAADFRVTDGAYLSYIEWQEPSSTDITEYTVPRQIRGYFDMVSTVQYPISDDWIKASVDIYDANASVIQSSVVSYIPKINNKYTFSLDVTIPANQTTWIYNDPQFTCRVRLSVLMGYANLLDSGNFQTFVYRITQKI